MTKYETTQNILDYFNPAKRLEKAESAFAKMTKARARTSSKRARMVAVRKEYSFDAE
jgi:hypothetical protein